MDYCEGHSGYGVDSQGNCLFCGKPRRFSDNGTDDIPARWRISKQKKPQSESIDEKSRERDSDHSVFKCKECGLVTLVKIKDWYVCVNKRCRACGSNPESVVRIEILYLKNEVNRHTESTTDDKPFLESTNIKPAIPEESIDNDIVIPAKDFTNGKINSEIGKNQISLQLCPECKQRSLMLNTSNNQYECLNNKCGRSFFMLSVDRYNQRLLSDQKALNELDSKKTRAWFGNQYYDPRKKKWRDGREPIKIQRKHNKWIWLAPLLLILISVILTIIINYFFPEYKFVIFGW